MQIGLDAILKLASPVLTALIGWVSKQYLEARPNLVTYLVHASAIPLNDERETIVNTHSIVVRNVGKRTATNVRIGHNNLPPSFQVFPPIPYTVTKGHKDSAEILIPTMVPDEQISVSYLYFPGLTWHNVNSYTKADHGFAEIINNIPSKGPSKILVSLFWGFAFLGASTVLYTLARWAIHLVSAGA